MITLLKWRRSWLDRKDISLLIKSLTRTMRSRTWAQNYGAKGGSDLFAKVGRPRVDREYPWNLREGVRRRVQLGLCGRASRKIFEIDVCATAHLGHISTFMWTFENSSVWTELVTIWSNLGVLLLQNAFWSNIRVPGLQDTPRIAAYTQGYQ